MRVFYRIILIIWHTLAVIGLVSLCLGIFGVTWFMSTYNLSPNQLVTKFVNKLLISLPEGQKDFRPKSLSNIPKSKYKRLPLSEQAISKRFSSAESGSRRIIHVGSGEKYKLPSDAARIAEDFDIIEIDAQEYFRDVAIWRRNNLTIRGVRGRPHLNAGGANAQGKAIWVTKGNNITIENIEFSNAKVRDRNGAGIRAEGGDLIIRNCVFHDNENGLLSGGINKDRTISVEYSEFAYNGHGAGQSHGIYINSARRFIFKYNYVHHSNMGHHIKSRAVENFIFQNRLMDEKDGNSSYAIDIPNGGLAVIIGNAIQQGENADNFSIIHYSVATKDPGNGLYVVNNTVLNDRHDGIFVRNRSPIDARIINNLVVGRLKFVDGPFEGSNNIKGDRSFFINADEYNFRLRSHAKAIDAGIDPGSINDIPLNPPAEYVHPTSRRDRPEIGKLDVGAFEFD